MSRARRIKSGVVIGVLVTSAALAPSAALGAGSGHHHAPTAAQLAHSQREVAARAHQVKVAARRIGDARAALKALNVTAEVAFEKYDGAEVKLQTAQRAADTARVVLNEANSQVASGQKRAQQFAVAEYEAGGLSSISAMLQPGGPAQLVSRIGAISAVTNSERTTIEQLTAAQIYQHVVSDRAEAVRGKAATAAAAAARAKATAEAAVARQQQQLASLQHQQAHLQSLLAGAKSTASRLAQEHLAALARARRRAAEQQQSPPPSGPTHSPYSGSSGSTAGTVSAATEAAALQDAESQIGKPYQWGAAGPNTYDCSGLVLWSYAQVGVSLDHFTGDQWNEGAHISQSQLRPGDLVFFATNTSDPSTIHHVGMYVGNGQMVDAPYTGVDVRYDAAFRSDYIGAVRPYQR